MRAAMTSHYPGDLAACHSRIDALEAQLAATQETIRQIYGLFAIPETTPLIPALQQHELRESSNHVDRLRMFELLIENVPDGIGIADFSGKLLYVNRANCDIYGYAEHEWEHVTLKDLEVPDNVPKAGNSMDTILEQGYIRYQTPNRRRDGTIFPAETTVWLLRNAAGEPVALGGITRDITEQQQQEERLRQAETERLAMQERVITAQQERLRELSTPLIPLVEGAVVMPLVGSIDSQRAQQILETLLEGVSQTQASIAILDITGVSMVDTQVANALIRAAQAVKLLGATVILTGIRPEVAQMLVSLGVGLGDIMTRSTLQSGVVEVLRLLRFR